MTEYVGQWQIERRESYRKSWHAYTTQPTLEEAIAEVNERPRGTKANTSVDGEGRTIIDHVLVHQDGYESPMQHFRISQIRALDGPETVSHRVGYVDVDAGIVQIGDPCYTLRKDYDENSGARYDDLIDHLGDPTTDEYSRGSSDRCVAPEGYSGAWMPYRSDMRGEPHEGAGVVVSSGFGDGGYPVTVEFYSRYHPDPMMRGRVKSVRVDFISDYDEEDEDD